MGFLDNIRILYTTKKFCDIWKDYNAFKTDYDSLFSLVAGGTATFEKTDSLPATYYLLYAKYGNTPINGTDDYQWKMKIMSIIASYGPTWEKKKLVQKDFRGLVEADLIQGAKQIYNRAYNPSTAPTTGTLEELDFINEQNTTNNKKSKMEAYSILWANLHNDPTKDYLDKFKVCFSRFVGDQFPIIYITETEEEEEEP